MPLKLHPLWAGGIGWLSAQNHRVTGRLARTVLLLSLPAVFGACLTSPDVPPSARCTKPGVGAHGGSLCALTKGQIDALPEANLVYPGSTVQYSFSDAGALNVNGEPTDADARSAFDTSAPPSAVSVWYDSQLRAAGWIHTGATGYMYSRCPPVSNYREYYSITVYGGLPAGAPESPPPAGGSFYETRLSIPSPAYEVMGSEASGAINTSPVPCSGASPLAPSNSSA